MKLSVIVPYRNRREHLKVFVPAISRYMEKVKERQRIERWEIIVVEQEEGMAFNRGKLLNVGFGMASKEFDYVVFHDVDMLPFSADYSYPKRPTHIATMCSQFGNKMPYKEYFGGVTLFSRKDFDAINGFSNEYWGWGAEDDDLRERCSIKKIEIDRRKCVFKSLDHDRNVDWNLHRKNVEKLKRIKCTKKYEEGLRETKFSILADEKVFIEEKKEKFYFRQISVSI